MGDGKYLKGLRGRFIFPPPLNSTSKAFIHLAHLNQASLSL